jgi:hypothetical protein
VGETRREERSPYGRLLSLPGCTNAESLELARASSMFLARVFLKVSAYWRGTFSH